MTTLTLVIPVLNHEDRLEEVIRDIRSLVAAPEPEVLVVYDVTRPELQPAVAAEQAVLQERYGARSLTRTNRRGFGSALREGIHQATGDVVIPIMGDCSDDLGVIPRMVQAIEAGADIVAGSRYMIGGRIVGDTLKQRLSRLYSWLIRAITGIPSHDISNSFKAFRRQVWEQVPTEAESFDISVEITVKAAARGFRITEVPSVWTNRRAGSSKFSMLRELRNYGRWLIYAARYFPQRGIVARTLGGSTALLGTIVMLGRVPGR